MAETAREEVLRILALTGLALSPADLAFNLGYSSGHVSRVCRKAANDGLLANRNTETSPQYEITQAGLDRVEATDLLAVE
ncbi:MAG: hypothetical protein ABEH64_09895 [Salinirussus sp.]